MRKLKRTLSYLLILITFFRLLLNSDECFRWETCRAGYSSGALRVERHEHRNISPDGWLVWMRCLFRRYVYFKEIPERKLLHEQLPPYRLWWRLWNKTRSYKFRYSDVSDCNKFADRFAQTTMQSGKNVYYAARNVDCSDMLLNMSQLAVIGGDGTLTLNW